MSYYRTAILLLLAVASAPLATMAQPHGQEPGFGSGRGPGTRGQDPTQRFAQLAEYLELSESQAVEVEAILTEQKAARRSHLETLRSANDELETLIESDSPDATLIGEKVLTIHAMRQAMRQRGEDDRTAIRELLTQEQIDKFDALQTARDLRGGHKGRGREGRQGQGHDRPRRGSASEPIDG